eukprot:3443933-Pyramimonas_sp.AAC.1
MDGRGRVHIAIETRAHCASELYHNYGRFAHTNNEHIENTQGAQMRAKLDLITIRSSNKTSKTKVLRPQGDSALQLTPPRGPQTLIRCVSSRHAPGTLTSAPRRSQALP